MSIEKPPASALPPSLGPGGKISGQGQNAGDIVRDVQEMRKHYTVAVEPTVLKVGYRIHDATRNYEISFDNSPLSGFRKWICYGGRGRALISGTFLLDMMRGAENMTGQPLSQREAEAFTSHAAKRMQYGFVGMGVALAAGYGMAARGRKQMKFPFRKPKPLENYDTFPLRRMPLLTGNFARLAWQTTRANIYAALGIILLSPLFRSMGESVMAVGLYRDERSREKVKAMKGGLDRIRMNRQTSAASQPVSPPAQQSFDESSSDTAFQRDDNQMQAYRGGSDNYAGDSDFSDSITDSGAVSDVTMRQRELQHSAPSAYGASRPTSTLSSRDIRQDQQQAGDFGSSTDFFFDGGSSKVEHSPATSGPQSSPRNGFDRGTGGTWDRIRQGGQSSQSSDAAPAQASVSGDGGRGGWRESSTESNSPSFGTGADSFSFSSYDTNRALAKEKAQKEFDGMLDRERRESGSDAYDRASHSTETARESPQQPTTGGSVWERRRRGN